MKIYMVGGAIRDKLLGIRTRDIDWLVVGSTYFKMINLGYKPIGNFFPVFINPKTKEEYALARKEKKNSIGYKGFYCNFNSDISLEEDLFRRDLTINSIAMDDNGRYYDPYNGIIDIQNRIIRHVSDYFMDDPLRLLRVARFYSYLLNFNFCININTLNLMKKIVCSGELNYITPERIWIEFKKVLNNKNIFFFFSVLNSCNAINIIFPEIKNLFNNLKIKYYFFLVFKNIDNLNFNLYIKFIFFCFFFNYTIFSKKYFIYSKLILFNVNNFCLKFKLPNKFFFYFKKIFLVIKLILNFGKKKKYNYLLDIFYELDIWRNWNIIFKLLNVLIILKIINFIDIHIIYFLEKNLFKICKLLKNININNYINLYNINKKNIKKYIYNLRLLILKKKIKLNF